MDMGNTLFQAICRMGIFMICAQAVVHFRPKESYEKYLKLLVSVIVLIQVFLPIGSFLLGDGRQNAARALEQLAALKGCQAHCSVILSPADANTYKKLGLQLTCEPKYQTNRLYHR